MKCDPFDPFTRADENRKESEEDGDEAE